MFTANVLINNQYEKINRVVDTDAATPVLSVVYSLPYPEQMSSPDMQD